MTTLMIIGLVVLGWLILAVVTWALCVSAARGDASLDGSPEGAQDRSDRGTHGGLPSVTDGLRHRRLPAA